MTNKQGKLNTPSNYGLYGVWGYVCSHGIFLVHGIARIVYNSSLASFEMCAQMEVYNYAWPDLVSAQELSHRQGLSLLIGSCLHKLYQHDNLALVCMHHVDVFILNQRG